MKKDADSDSYQNRHLHKIIYRLEKKIEFISNIFTNSLFENSINPQDSNHLLHLISNLSYRKLCIISYYTQRNNFPEIVLANLGLTHPTNNNTSAVNAMIVLQDIFELRALGFLDLGENDKSVSTNRTMINMDRIILSSIGNLYSNLLEIKNIKKEDILLTMPPFIQKETQ